MNGFSRNYEDFWEGRENEKNRGTSGREEKHTRLVIDEDSIYEIDLDCVECKKREEQDYFR